MLRSAVLFCLTMCLITLSCDAHAAYYEFVARYRSHGDGAVQEVVADGEGALPLDTLTHSLEDVVIRLKDDAASAAQIADIRNIVVVVGYGNEQRIKPFSDPKPGAVKVLLEAKSFRKNASVVDVRFEVQSKFTATRLCEVERDKVRDKAASFKTPEDLRNWLRLPKLEQDPKKPGAKPKSTEAEKAGEIDVDKATVDQLGLYKLLATQGVVAGQSLLFSFCFEGDAGVDWEKVEKATGVSKEKYKDRTAAKVLSALRDELASATIHYGQPNAKYPKNMYASDSVVVPFAPFLAGDLAWYEDAPSEKLELFRTVDQASTIIIKPTPAVCRQIASCTRVAEAGTLYVTIDSTDSSGKAVTREAALKAQGDYWSVDAKLSDFLLQQVKLTLHYRIGKTSFPIASRSFAVENLGLITTFPVVSEIASLAAEWNDEDLESKSSIPISWAYNFNGKDGRFAAVTFPWMIGYNPRNAPRLANLVKVFPHISLLAPLSESAESGRDDATAEDKGAPQMLLGAGVALVSAFTLGWGISVTDDKPANFFMVGLSAPDLVKMFQGASDTP